LFEDHNWLHVRVPQCEYDYTGYLDDLRIAWDIAHKEVLHQINISQDPSTFAYCIRYALIHSCINSISGNYDPPIVERALTIGMWQPNRALAVTAKVPDAQQRTKLYTAIPRSNTLSHDKQTKVQRLALEAASAIATESSRSSELAELAPYLTDEHLQDCFIAAMSIMAAWDRAGALTALAAYLTGDQKNQALQAGLAATLTVEDEASRLSRLEKLIPQLSGEQLQHALEAALAMQSEENQVRALAALALQLTGEQKHQVLQAGLEAALAIADAQSRARALAVLAPHPQLTDEQKHQVLQAGLEAALAIADEGDRASDHTVSRRAHTFLNPLLQLGGEVAIEVFEGSGLLLHVTPDIVKKSREIATEVFEGSGLLLHHIAPDIVKEMGWCQARYEGVEGSYQLM
jgi:hypothetical protein